MIIWYEVFTKTSLDGWEDIWTTHTTDVINQLIASDVLGHPVLDFTSGIRDARYNTLAKYWYWPIILFVNRQMAVNKGNEFADAGGQCLGYFRLDRLRQ